MISAEAVLDATCLDHQPSGHLWGHWVDVVDDLGDIARVHVELPAALMSSWTQLVARMTARFGPLPSSAHDDPELLRRCAELLEEMCSAGASPPTEVRLESRGEDVLLTRI